MSIRDRLRGARTSDAPPAIVDSATDAERAIVERALPFTMVSPERLLACVDAATHVVSGGVAGAFVECGVWKGGSVLSMILTLQQLGVTDRDIYLFDTFEGMTAPTDEDTSRFSTAALTAWEQAKAAGRKAWHGFFDPEVFDRSRVEELIFGTGYPRERIHFVQGRVEDTIPENAPQKIALLRLDTDWYESTRHELVHLYPSLEPGGVLIIDDYGHWDGCRRAVDEYFSSAATPPLLSRIDYTGRIAVKR
jgi:O-methyltransferase